jgi:beta-glucosidase
VAAMTLDEKTAITAGQDLWTVPGVERLGIPSLAVTDGPNGARGTSLPGPGAAPTTCVPCGAALGATWDPELLRRVGVLLGHETRARSCRVLLAPTVNIPRSPLAGRNFECYSEDPQLSGVLAAAFIQGVQSQDVATTVKHFVGNDAETERYTMSSVIDERSLREIYLIPFEQAVRQGRTLGVMTGYNRLNGKWCSEDRHLVTDILRDQWGFDGFVLTDWYAVASSVGSQAAGVDLEMPGPGRAYGPALADAVRRGLVPEAALDEQVGRLLSVYARLGLLDGEGGGAPPPRLPAPERAALAREAAAASMVLLRNNGVLPLDDSVRTVAVIGANAATAVIMGGGSANVRPDHETSPLDALRARLGPEVTVRHEQGVDLARGASPLAMAMTADYTVGHGLDGPLVHRGELPATEMSRTDSPVPGRDGPFSVRATGVFLPGQSGRYRLTLTHVGRARILVDGVVVLDGFDETLPRGSSFLGLGSEELSHEVQWEAGHPVELTVEYDNRGAKGLFAFRLACRWLAPDDLVERAVAAAAAAEVAVVVVGTSSEWESEGFDRPTLCLPRRQDELVAKVAAANPNTVVVVNTGAPVAMPWTEQVAAVLQAWFGGQEMATALADVLTGASDPGGRLPVTIPVRLEDTPAYGNFPGERNDIRYGEGLFVGYRWYEARRMAVTFPFGHGLSYASFALGAPELSSSTFTPGGELVVRVPVTNTGVRAGTEVVQCYVAPAREGLLRPEKELKAFAKIGLDRGETGAVTLVLSDRTFAYWDPGTTETARLQERMALGTMLPPGDTGRGAGWRIDPGQYELCVGRSSADIAWRVRITVEGSSTSDTSG